MHQSSGWCCCCRPGPPSSPTIVTTEADLLRTVDSGERMSAPPPPPLPLHRRRASDDQGPAHASVLGDISVPESLTAEQHLQMVMTALSTPLASYSSDVSASGHGGSSATLVRLIPAVAARPAVPARPIPTSVRIGSWNVNHLNDRLLLTAPATAVVNVMAEIINSHFDVVVLQEVTSTTSNDVLQQLLSVMRSKFSHEDWESRWTGKGEMHCFFLRRALVESTSHAAECITDGLTHDAGLLFVACTLPRFCGFRLALLSVHLKSAEPATASAELTSLVQLMERHSSSIIAGDGALIVLGDFNLDKAEIDAVLQSLLAKRNKFKSKLVPHIQHTTMSSATSIKCNDNILVSERLTVIQQSARVIDVADVSLDPQGLLCRLSDHLPVVVAVQIAQ